MNSAELPGCGGDSRSCVAFGRAFLARPALRRLDAAGYDKILIEAPVETEPWWAVWDRIQRATNLNNL